MNPGDTERILALVCDREGKVLRILRNDLPLAGQTAVGAAFSNFAGPAMQEAVERFLHKLSEGRILFESEDALQPEGSEDFLHLSGVGIDDGLLVFASASPLKIERINRELMLINNEQTNLLRSAFKDLSLRSRRPNGGDDELYESFSRLNNELTNLHRDLTRKNTELEVLNEQKNRFVGMAAHDLRSPLGVILTYSGLLNDEAGPHLNEEQREFITTIQETSRSMLRLVEDLLDVSFIEAGRLELHLQTTDLARLIERNVAMNRLLAARKDIGVTFHPPPTAMPPVILDAGKIGQVLDNLIGNAVKFSDPGMMVDVFLTVDAACAQVTVQDQGQGIPAADLPGLFKPFGKTSTRGTAGEAGNGLGLAIANRIIEGHGGWIRVESTLGHGSRFAFALPIPCPAPPRRNPL